mgnify:CR=1 FL=1
MSNEPELPLEPGHDSAPPDGAADGAHHLATLSHDGGFWDVYVEFDDDPSRVDSFGGVLCFSPAAAGGGSKGPVRTTTILIERSYEEVLHRARQFENHHLVALLRSCLPEEEQDERPAS